MRHRDDQRKVRLEAPMTTSGHATTHVEIAVCYRKGGTNMFSGTIEPRGYEAMINPVTVKDGMVSFLLGNNTGGRAFVEAAGKFNAKRLEDLAARILPRAERAKEIWLAGDTHGALRFLVKGETEPVVATSLT